MMIVLVTIVTGYATERPRVRKNASVGLTAAIVMAYVSNNFLQRDHVPGLIESVHAALSALEQAGPEPEVWKPTRYQIKTFITPDALNSFIDGKPYQQLGHHIAAHRMSFAEYRFRFGLPHDYPSAAPNISSKRAEQAVANGHGTRYGRHLGRKERV